MKWFQICAGFTAVLSLLFVAVCVTKSRADDKAKKSNQPKIRSFRLDYGATLTDLPPGAKVRVWLPVPQTTEHQTIKELSRELPGKPQVNIELKFGNKILYFEANAPESGEVSFQTSYQVRRMEVRGLASETGDKNDLLIDAQRKQFLAPDRLVPVKGKPLDLIRDFELPKRPLDLARVLYNRVDDHVRYDKSRPGYGNGDSEWVCDSRFGNCTDFHSLFISLARSQGVPALFEIGFPLPPERGKGTIGGYHCWALFYADGQGWVPVDISEADKHPDMKEYYFGNLTEDRVTFTAGRDIDLVPQQAGEPLNFFVYPYAEVDGQPWPKDKSELRFAYADRSN